jgi:hypothetical protein
MLKSDRYLAGIVVAVLALAVVAFVLALRQPAPTYRADGGPDATVHNYLLALRQRDFERAYGYLSTSIRGYPQSVTRFTDAVTASPMDFGLQDSTASALRVSSSPVITDDSAVVNVEETAFNQGGLFGSSEWTSTFSVTLKRQDDGWRIVSVSPSRYWDTCWTDPADSLCRERAIELARPETGR